MKRSNATQRDGGRGERQLSPAARAAIARASGASPPTADASTHATRSKRRVRSALYNIVSQSTVNGGTDPEQQRRAAQTIFRMTMVGCLVFLYLPMMGIGYLIVGYNSNSSSNPTHDGAAFGNNFERNETQSSSVGNSSHLVLEQNEGGVGPSTNVSLDHHAGADNSTIRGAVNTAQSLV